MLKGGIGGMFLMGLIILITTVLFLVKIADLDTFLGIVVFVTGFGFITAFIFFIMGLFQNRYLKNLFEDCNFTYFKVTDFKKLDFSKYKTITSS